MQRPLTFQNLMWASVLWTVILHVVLQHVLCFQLLSSQSLALNFDLHSRKNTEWLGNIWPIVWVSFPYGRELSIQEPITSLIRICICKSRIILFHFIFACRLTWSLLRGRWWKLASLTLHWSDYRLIKLQCSFMELKDVRTDLNGNNNEVKTLIGIYQLAI